MRHVANLPRKKMGIYILLHSTDGTENHSKALPRILPICCNIFERSYYIWLDYKQKVILKSYSIYSLRMDSSLGLKNYKRRIILMLGEGDLLLIGIEGHSKQRIL